MIAYKDGDLLEAEEILKVHQVNCQGVMSSGLADQVRKKHPMVFDLYKAACDLYKGKEEELLGNIQPVRVGRKDGSTIVNLFGQLDFGRGKKHTNESALRIGLEKVKKLAQDHGLSVALPYKIGSDRGGAKWEDVRQIIEEVFSDYDVTIYKYNK
jgi:O-acetyl-ADP-ribose deacetylase (regulator of RNase III)